MTIVSRGALEELGESQYGLTPVGTGPFRVTAHDLGQSVVLERFADYYDPERPKLDKVTITPIIDAEPLAAAIEAGDIQLIGGNPIAPEIVDRFLAEPRPGGQHRAGAHLPERLDEPLARALRGHRLQQAARGADAGERLQGAACDRQGARSRALHRAGAVRPRHAGLRHDQPGAWASSSTPAWAKPATSASTSRRPSACSPRPAIRTARAFPPLKIIHTPDQRREVQVIANILNTNLGITLEPDTRDFPVLIEEFDKMDFDLVRLGSGGDYDPDDGLVDWMQTTSKFNGRLRDKDKMAVRRLLRCQGRRADRSAAPGDRSGAAQGAGAGGQQDHLRQGGERLPVPPDGHPGPSQQR